MSQYQYISSSNLFDRYGTITVNLWADVNATGDGTEISAQITNAITIASAIFDGYMLASPYSSVLPLLDANGDVPIIVANIVTKLAADWLATTRGTRDMDEHGKPISPLEVDYQRAMADVAMIQAAKLRLPNVPTG
jgi:hypothetical protein